jgi:hypothetical protein
MNNEIGMEDGIARSLANRHFSLNRHRRSDSSSSAKCFNLGKR